MADKKPFKFKKDDRIRVKPGSNLGRMVDGKQFNVLKTNSRLYTGMGQYALLDKWPYKGDGWIHTSNLELLERKGWGKVKPYTVVRELTGSAVVEVLARNPHEAEDKVDWSKVKEDIEVLTLSVYEGHVEDDLSMHDPVLEVDY